MLECGHASFGYGVIITDYRSFGRTRELVCVCVCVRACVCVRIKITLSFASTND